MISSFANLIAELFQFMSSHGSIDQLQTKRSKKTRNIFLDFLSVFEITIIHFFFHH